MRVSSLLLLAAIGAPVLASAGCKRQPASQSTPSEASSAAARALGFEPIQPLPPSRPRGESEVPEGPIVGAIVGQVNILAEPVVGAKRLGYLRLGGIVKREPEVAGKAGCPGGWYRVHPRGFICTGEEATTDRDNPILKAAGIVRPRLDEAMPYRYGFVRAVLPLYLKAPSQEEQLKSEFKLKEHLDKWEAQKDELNKVSLGAYDVPIDERGMPLLGKKPGEVPTPSTSLGQGVLFGANAEDDPIPWWLDGGRKIPNLSDFKVPPYAVFADRARRHTGLSFVGSFQMGPEAFSRRFAITTDLRMAPITKVKPDTGSPWHGIELMDPAKSPPMPFAWVRTSDAKAYRMVDGKPREKGSLDKRSIVLLTGRKVPGPDGFYWELKNGLFIRASHAGVVRAPDEWPEAAKKGGKWIEVSIENQTLTLWQGQKAVFATLVSTGQDGMGDPKKTKSTVRGVFSIQSKHVTATMDSNEGSSAGGGRRPSVSSPSKDEGDEGGKKKGGGKKEKKGDGEAKAKKGGDKAADKKGEAKAKKGGDEKWSAATSQTEAKRAVDPEYGVTKRRGEGAFWLRDVPYVQYFESSYALHVAYWHDVFGIARSHGCINLSPLDGRYIFRWTDPPIPEGWHGIVTTSDTPATAVIVHE